MSLGAKEAVCIREMCRRLIKLHQTPVMSEDNSAAVVIVKSEDSQSLKHIVNLCYHYIRLEVSRGNIRVLWIPTDQQLADFFTKALGHEKFTHFRNLILDSA